MPNATGGKPATEMTRHEQVAAHNRHWAYADQVFEMFTRGESFRAMQRATGVPLATLHLMVKRLSAEYVDDRYGDRTAVVGRELAILDSLTRKNLKAAQNGVKAAAEIVLQASRDRRKLLGLDAATALEVSLKTPTDVEIERLVAMLADLDDTADPYATG